jgi:hypothetical protein
MNAKKKKNKNPVAGKPLASGAPAKEQDIKRRLGNFTGAGEHARQGGRHGIVGQTTKKTHTDKKS